MPSAKDASEWSASAAAWREGIGRLSSLRPEGVRAPLQPSPRSVRVGRPARFPWMDGSAVVRRAARVDSRTSSTRHAFRSVSVAEHLADHAAVLALRQAVVVAAPWARLGNLLHAQFLQRRGQLVVYDSGPLSEWKPCTTKGGGQQTLRDRQQEVLANTLYSAGELVLGDLVDEVDVIAPLDVVEVALMHRGDADPVWVALGTRLAADVDQWRRGARGVAAAEHPCVVLYFTLIRYDFSDWAVAIAVDPASRKNVDSIVELAPSPLGSGANREWVAIRGFYSHCRELSGAVDRHCRF